MTDEDKINDTRYQSFQTVSSQLEEFEGFNRMMLPDETEHLNQYFQAHEEVVEKYYDLPLQLNEHGKCKGQSRLLVEEKGERKDYIGSHKVYEISEFDSQGEKRILCQRRYDNFNQFYECIKRSYAFLLIPRLVGKNPFNKIIAVDSEFYERRLRQLNYFTNFIYYHNKLKRSREFQKFLNDPEFDDEFFKRSEKPFQFPETAKVNETIKNRIYGVFSNFSNYFSQGAEDPQMLPSGDEQIAKMEPFYRKMLEHFKEIKGNMSVCIADIKKVSINYAGIADNLFYLKGVNFNMKDAKESLQVYHDVCRELHAANTKLHTEKAVKLDNEFEGFVSVLQGLVDVFERYQEFLDCCKQISKALADYQHNSQHYDKQALCLEKEKSEKIRSEAEKVIKDEVSFFTNKYKNEYLNLLEEFKALLSNLNQCEIEAMRKYTDNFK